MKILHSLKDNLDKLLQIANSDLGLLQEVSAWAEHLTSLREIKSQKYQMLTLVYTVEEIDKLED